MRITPAEIQHVARLARLDLSETEVVNMAGQVDRILSYVDTMNELDTTGVAPSSHAIALQNAFRDDIPAPSLPREQALANAPHANGEAFVVPRVI